MPAQLEDEDMTTQPNSITEYLFSGAANHRDDQELAGRMRRYDIMDTAVLADVIQTLSKEPNSSFTRGFFDEHNNGIKCTCGASLILCASIHDGEHAIAGGAS
jgi:hypothetical protein